MGEYADLQIRADIKRRFGYDPGDMSDEDTPRKPRGVMLLRTKCPYCPSRPKAIGLQQHIRDVHGVRGESLVPKDLPVQMLCPEPSKDLDLAALKAEILEAAAAWQALKAIDTEPFTLPDKLESVFRKFSLP